jgi:hypothetical protein
MAIHEEELVNGIAYLRRQPGEILEFCHGDVVFWRPSDFFLPHDQDVRRTRDLDVPIPEL